MKKTNNKKRETKSLQKDNEYFFDLSLNKLSYNNNHSVDSISRPTDNRIDFVKSILANKVLDPLVDYDDCTTEVATNPKLHKKIIDANNLFNKMGVILQYLKSGSTGHTFKALSNLDNRPLFAVKVCAYPKDSYGGITNIERPENAEIRMLKLLTKFVVDHKSPHFVLPIATFNSSIEGFIGHPSIDINDKKNRLYRKFVVKYQKGRFENFVSVLISEWCNGGDLMDYIRRNYESMTLEDWKVIFFQLLYTLAKIHERYPAFRHNDLKPNNILVVIDNKKYTSDYKYKYTIGDNDFYIPHIGLQIKIWDFDFSCISGVIENNKVNADWTDDLNITRKRNQYYDVHYFFNTLSSESFFPQINQAFPKEIFKFINDIIPSEYRGKEVPDLIDRYRIIVDEECYTPYQIIRDHPFFSEYKAISPKRKPNRRN